MRWCQSPPAGHANETRPHGSCKKESDDRNRPEDTGNKKKGALLRLQESLEGLPAAMDEGLLGGSPEIRETVLQVPL